MNIVVPGVRIQPQDEEEQEKDNAEKDKKKARVCFYCHCPGRVHSCRRSKILLACLLSRTVGKSNWKTVVCQNLNVQSLCIQYIHMEILNQTSLEILFSSTPSINVWFFTSRNDALLKALTDDIRACASVLRKHRETLESVAESPAQASDTHWASR